jgi:neutral trehalase
MSCVCVCELVRRRILRAYTRTHARTRGHICPPIEPAARIVLGLLASDAHATARGVIENLLDDVRAFGFVPNGGRVYYLNRSQPPLLSDMVLAWLGANDDAEFAIAALPVLEQEYAYWMSEAGGHAVRAHPDAPSLLNRYFADAAAAGPRPESFREDLQTAEEAGAEAADLPEDVFADLAAGAESGWDFSSRWMAAPSPATGAAATGSRGTGTGAAGTAGANSSASYYSLSRIATRRVLPVELNAVLYRMEHNLALLHTAAALAPAAGSMRALAAVLLPETDATPLPAGSGGVGVGSRRSAEGARVETEAWERTRRRLIDALADACCYASSGGCGAGDAVRLPELPSTARRYLELASARAVSMAMSLFDESSHLWIDAWLPGPAPGAALAAGAASSSLFFPLWAGVHHDPALRPRFGSARARAALLRAAINAAGPDGGGGGVGTGVELVQDWGVMTTSVAQSASGQQWDAPNAWAPVQLVAVEGLVSLQLPDALRAARSLVDRWLETNFAGWAAAGLMFEKYNARERGQRGEGGEYPPQAGFGWSNGVVLHMLRYWN